MTNSGSLKLEQSPLLTGKQLLNKYLCLHLVLDNPSNVERTIETVQLCTPQFINFLMLLARFAPEVLLAESGFDPSDLLQRC